MSRQLDEAADALLLGSRHEVERNEVPRPALAMVRGGRQLGAVFGRAREKYAVMREMALFAATLRPDEMVCVHDAYVSEPPATIPPSEDPAATEAVIEVRLTTRGGAALIVHPYRRDDRGHVTWGERAPWEGHVEGALIDVLALAFRTRTTTPVDEAAAFLRAYGHQVVLVPGPRRP